MAVNSKLLDLPIAEANKQITATLGAALKLGTDVRFVGSGSSRYAERRLSNGTWKDLRQYRAGTTGTISKNMGSLHAGGFIGKALKREPNQMPTLFNYAGTANVDDKKFVKYFDYYVPWQGTEDFPINTNTQDNWLGTLIVSKDWSKTIVNDETTGQHVEVVRLHTILTPKAADLNQNNKQQRPASFNVKFPDGVLPTDVEFVKCVVSKHLYTFTVQDETKEFTGSTEPAPPTWANNVLLIGNTTATAHISTSDAPISPGLNNRFSGFFGSAFGDVFTRRSARWRLYTYQSSSVEPIAVYNQRVESANLVSFQTNASNWWKPYPDRQHVVWRFFIEVRGKAKPGVYRHPRAAPQVAPFTTQANLSDHSKEISWNI